MAFDITSVLDLPVAPVFQGQSIAARKIARIIQPISTATLEAAKQAAIEVVSTDLDEKAQKGENSDITGLSGLTTPLSAGQGGTGLSSLAALAAPGNPVGDALDDRAARGANSDITSLGGLTTPLSQGQGGSGAATLGGATVQVPGFPASQVGAWLKAAPIEVYGAVADFSGDPTTATDNTIAINNARKSGKPIRLSGWYYTSQNLDVIGDVHEVFQGCGRDMSGIVLAANCTRGFKSSKSKGGIQTDFRDFSVKTLGQENIIGFDVSYARDGLATPRGVYQRLGVTGWDRTQHGPKGGLLLVDNLWCVIDDIYTEGRQVPGKTTAADFTPADYVVRCETTASSGCGYIGKIRGYAIKRGFDAYAPAGAIEGINIGYLDLVDVLWGLYADFTSFAAGLVVAAGHINAFLGGVFAKYCPEAQFSNLLLYKHPNSDSATNFIGLSLDVCTGAQANNIKVSNFTSSTKLQFAAISRSSGMQISGTTSGGDADVTFDDTSSANFVDLVVQGTPSGALYTETAASTGKNQVTRRFVPTSAKNTSAATSSGATQTLASATITLRQGERRRVTATLQHTAAAGATASTVTGEVILLVTQTGGSGSVAFFIDAPNARDREVQTASNQTLSVSAPMTCTGTGTVRIDAQVLATGTGGTVAAGDCQLVIE